MGLKYEPSLDGIRALAALLVVVAHVSPESAPGFGLGVDVFFVLSGYLITSLLRRELSASGRIDFGAFIARRMRRLYPALLLMILGALVAMPFLWPHSQWEAIPAALYFTNLTRAFGKGSVLSHTWSLGVEFQFYLLWPLILPLILKTGRPRMILALVYVAATLVRLPMPDLLAFNLRVSGLVLGSLVALLPPIRGGWAAPALAAIVATMLACSNGPPPLVGWAGFPAVEIAAAVLVASAPASGRVLACAPLVFLGEISYGIYLWHAPIANALRTTGQPLWLVLSGTYGLAIILAWLSFVLVERPIRALGRKPALVINSSS